MAPVIKSRLRSRWPSGQATYLARDYRTLADVARALELMRQRASGRTYLARTDYRTLAERLRGRWS